MACRTTFAGFSVAPAAGARQLGCGIGEDGTGRDDHHCRIPVGRMSPLSAMTDAPAKTRTVAVCLVSQR
jgi:hypothetical protein